MGVKNNQPQPYSIMDKGNSPYPEGVRYYDPETHTVVKKRESFFPVLPYFKTNSAMAVKLHRELGANCRTLVWQYLCSNMDYNNEVHPVVAHISDSVGFNRQNVSLALSELQKRMMIVNLNPNPKPRQKRAWMINPDYANRASKESQKEVYEKWKYLLEQHGLKPIDTPKRNMPKDSTLEEADFEIE